MNWLRQIIARTTLFRRLPRLLRKFRVPILLLWAAAIFSVTQSEKFGEFVPFQDLDHRSIDWRFKSRGYESANPDIVIVGITDSSLDTDALRALAPQSDAIALMAAQRVSSWNRKVWAALIERLMQAGAKVVAVDLLFDGQFPGNDELAAVVARYRDRLVLGARFEIPPGGENASYRVPDSAVRGEGDLNSFVGACTFHIDIDGVIRRFNFRTSVEREAGRDEQFLADFGIEDDVISFAPLAVAKFSGKEAPHGLGQLIDFQGKDDLYPAFPMEEILADSIFLKDPKYRGGEVFKDKVVFVGPISEIMHDIHVTPFGSMPGVKIHAQLAGAILAGRPLRDAPASTNFWLTLAVTAVTAGLVILLRQAPAQSAAVAGLAVVLAVTTQLYFTRANTVVPVIAPMFALVCVGLFGVVLTFAIEQLEKARIRGVLNQYVSKNVADVVLKHAEDFEQMMRGERRNVTIVFSDVRGFTSIFESADASALVEQLNEYFEKMVGCIQQVDGTVQKFIGDAIMAAWGDTHSLGYSEDAERAVRSALAMRVALRELNAKWQGNPARVPMKTGIGVNHGEVVVGEVGSQGVRKEFTLLGDAVNSAARFESATKQYHVDLLVGGSVEELTHGKFVYRAVDRARFKGKTHPIDVFTVLGDGADAAPAWLARWHEAVELFRGAKFAEARSLFEKVAAEIGTGDFLCEMYLERIAEYRRTPPAADWDGAQTLSEK